MEGKLHSSLKKETNIVEEWLFGLMSQVADSREGIMGLSKTTQVGFLKVYGKHRWATNCL